MKHILSILFTLLFPLSVLAHDFEAINEDSVTIYYNKISDTECEVTYFENSAFSAKYSGSINIPASVTFAGSTFNVSRIGNYAFCWCTSLSSVSIPSSVSSIDNYAFFDCTSLESISLPNSITSIGSCAFWGCSSLTAITLSNSLISIGSSAFSGCASLASIILPNSISLIEGAVFYRCTSLTSISVDHANPNYSSQDGVLFSKDKTTLICYPGGKQGNYTIPNSISSIGEMAFAYSIRLTSITIPNSVKEIGRGAFAGCTAISSVSIPNSISEISRGAFSGCSSLKSITIGNSVTKIGESAFWDCSALTDVTVLAETPPFCSNNYDESNYTAFDDSDGTIHITLHVPAGSKEKYAAAEVWKDFERITDIGKQFCVDGLYYNILSDEEHTCEVTVSGDLLDEYGRTVSSYTGTITIPDHILYNGEEYKVTKIGSSAFSNSTVKSVTIPNTVTNIGWSAFAYCSTLSAITIPNSVSIIDNDAFRGCTGLTSIDIPDGVKSIGDWAFSGCSALSSVSIGSGVTMIGEEAFSGCSSLTKAEFASIEHLCNIDFWWADSNPLYYAHHLYIGGKEITDVAIPNTVTALHDFTFAGSYITSVTIPNTITGIDWGSFANCKYLSSISIPNSVKYITGCAFSYCPSLTEVTVLSNTPPSVYDTSFDYTEGIIAKTLHVPAGCKAKYMTAEVWKDFENIVEDAIDYPYLLEVPSNTYATLYLHYNAQIPDGMKVYVGKSTDYGYLQLEEITGTIPANTGVVVQAPAGSYELAITTASSQATSVLMGVNEDTAVESGTTLVLSEHDGVVGFYRYGGTMLKAHRAYLPVSVAKNGTIRISMPDGIQEVMSEDSDAVQYDLFGNRLQNRQKGINIENGKLIYVK